MTGSEQAVAELLTIFGWASNHVYPLRTKHGWRTGYSAKGWPDFVALKGDRIVAIEVKEGSGRIKREQIGWLSRFADLPNGHAWVIRPADLQDMVDWLRRIESAPTTYGFDYAAPTRTRGTTT